MLPSCVLGVCASHSARDSDSESDPDSTLDLHSASDSASEHIRSKYPLSNARIKVSENKANPGHYFSVLQLQPHFQLDQMISSIKLITELSPHHKIKE